MIPLACFFDLNLSAWLSNVFLVWCGLVFDLDSGSYWKNTYAFLPLTANNKAWIPKWFSFTTYTQRTIGRPGREIISMSQNLIANFLCVSKQNIKKCNFYSIFINLLKTTHIVVSQHHCLPTSHASTVSLFQCKSK